MTKLPVHYSAACPDCPGSRLGVLQPLVGETKEACAFATGHVAAREPLPTSWGIYGFGLVRRGVVIRQRIDEDGTASAIDAAGPGCVFPIDSSTDTAGYAANEVIVCLCPRDTMDRTIASGEVGGDLMDLHRTALARVERLAHARGASNVRRKVARVLVTLAETLSPPRIRDDLPPGMQQRDLAALVGVRHETFNRTIAAFEREGRLRRRPGGAIEHLELEKLRTVD